MPEDPAFGRLFDRFGASRVVLLGEASHGTAEFYRARAAITRHLIEAHGFSIVAVEADWPDAAAIERYVRDRAAVAAPSPFQRFPFWMWRNREFADFVAALREINRSRPADARAAFYGLDLYSLSASMSAVVAYLDATDPGAAALARSRYACLTPWRRDPAVYGRAARHDGLGRCEAAVVAQLSDMLARRLADGTDAALLDATQNARLVAAAERYYREMYRGSADSWNLRDTHMFETLCAVLDAHGPDSRAVVWAHNSHIGDARATRMGRDEGELNLGQLCRERFGEQAALVGFGTHTGEVAAASDWDGPLEIKRVLPARPDSQESRFHEAGLSRALLDLRTLAHPGLRLALHAARLERFIGVIYRPETEYHSHYAEADLASQFYAYVWFDRTTAVTPVGMEPAHDGTLDLFPFGV
ncbi:erythromycin esterase family protein [Chitinasiproducens palmae]|uniref:Erythromycin esterase homolog n=1 Tax=Chitinasiproducens palmae TaxID=1770053 RepID=A0A1H2PKI7_9BURK|nr:Erythromycin esterase homolog [Chitinasiproducens palmae]